MAKIQKRKGEKNLMRRLKNFFWQKFTPRFLYSHLHSFWDKKYHGWKKMTPTNMRPFCSKYFSPWIMIWNIISNANLFQFRSIECAEIAYEKGVVSRPQLWIRSLFVLTAGNSIKGALITLHSSIWTLRLQCNICYISGKSTFSFGLLLATLENLIRFLRQSGIWHLFFGSPCLVSFLALPGSWCIIWGGSTKRSFGSFSSSRATTAAAILLEQEAAAALSSAAPWLQELTI